VALACQLHERKAFLGTIWPSLPDHLASMREASFGPPFDQGDTENCPYDDPAEKAPEVQHANTPGSASLSTIGRNVAQSTGAPYVPTLCPINESV
jgi:hypothetical protein